MALDSSTAPTVGYTPLETARARLMLVWFAGSGVLLAALIVQSILGKYGPEIPKVFAWFVPTVAPTLGLMLGVAGAAALASADPRRVKTAFFKLAFYLSISYVVVVGLTIFLEPFSPMQPLELFSFSNYWIAPCQALAAGAISYLFTAAEKDPDR